MPGIGAGGPKQFGNYIWNAHQLLLLLCLLGLKLLLLLELQLLLGVLLLLHERGRAGRGMQQLRRGLLQGRTTNVRH